MPVSQVPVGGGRQITDGNTGQALWVLQLTAGDFTAFNSYLALLIFLSGVNYFFGLTTTISPDQRRLLFDA